MAILDEILILPLLIGSSIASGMIFRLYRYRGLLGASDLILTIAFGSSWALLYALELAETDVDEKLIWAKLQYIAIAGIAPAWFTYVYKYVRSQGKHGEVSLGWRKTALLYTLPVLIQPLVWTNSHHRLLWPEIKVVERGDMTILDLSHGPVYYLINVYALGLLFTGGILLLRFAARKRGMFLGHRLLIFGATVLPLIGNITYGSQPEWLSGIDPTPFLLIVAACLLGAALIRYGGIEMVSMARDTALDLLPHVVLVLDDELYVLEVNEVGTTMLGKRRSQICGFHVTNVIQTEPDLSLVLNEVAGNGRARELRYESEGKPTRILSLNCTGIGGAASVQRGWVVMLDDVTRERSIENDLRTARDEARAANEAKSAFLANMSHEIRTPMNGILGMAQLILQGPLAPAQRRHAEFIAQSGEGLLVILNDILDLSKIESGKLAVEKQGFILKDSIWEVCALFAEDTEKRGLEFDIHIDSSLPQCILGDQLRFRQILQNLLSNAVKFTHHGGVCLSVAEFREESASPALRIEVRDTGIGMSQEQIEKIQLAFEQADATTARKYGGTGLGVTIMIQLTELMGGVFTIDSKEGEGTTVTVQLPLEEAKTVQRAAASAVPQPPEPTATPIDSRVLVVDDNQCNQEVAKGLLSFLVTTVEVAGSAEEAIELAKSAIFDAVFMDIQMPVMNGFEATEIIRGLRGYSDVPIIAMTASAMQEDRQRCDEVGMTDFLAKPVRMNELNAIVNRWLGHASGDDGTLQLAKGSVNPDPPGEHSACLQGATFDPRSIKELLGENADIVTESLDVFIHSATQSLQGFREAVGSGDVEAAHRAVHSLRSTAGYLGGNRLQSLAQQMEMYYKKNAPEEAIAFLPLLAEETKALLEAVAQFQDSSTVAAASEQAAVRANNFDDASPNSSVKTRSVVPASQLHTADRPTEMDG